MEETAQVRTNQQNLHLYLATSVQVKHSLQQSRVPNTKNHIRLTPAILDRAGWLFC
jgi:hypothetical protein